MQRTPLPERINPQIDGAQDVQAVALRHGDVQQHDVHAAAAAHTQQGIGAVGRLGAHPDVGCIGEQLPSALAHDEVVVTDENADHGGADSGKGITRRTRVPAPGVLSMLFRPPKCPARSRMPVTPKLCGSASAAAAAPTPSPRTSM